jgi:hypothetical protein
MPVGEAGLPFFQLTMVEHTPLNTALQPFPGGCPKKQKAPSGIPEGAIHESEAVKFLVSAARKQRHQHHQIRESKQPLVRLLACCFRGTRDKAQVPALRKITDVVYANASQTGNFRVGEDFLTRFYGNHGLVPRTTGYTALPIALMLLAAYAMHHFQSNSSSVLYTQNEMASTFVPSPCVKRHYLKLRAEKLSSTEHKELITGGKKCPTFTNSI